MIISCIDFFLYENLGKDPNLAVTHHKRWVTVFYARKLLRRIAQAYKGRIEALDGQITAHKRKVLIDKGAVSHAQAIKKAEQEFEIYRQREMEMLESDFDREIKKLKEKN